MMTCNHPVASMLASRPRNRVSVSTPETPSVNPQNPHPLRKHRIVPAFADRADRTSFSSTKESDTGVAQSFTNSKTSSYLRWEVEASGSEEAIDDTISINSGVDTPVEQLPQESGMVDTQSTLHGLVCPCDSFRGWKNISIGGKVASKSFGDLRRLALRWDWEPNGEQNKKANIPLLATPNLKTRDGAFLPGQSPLEKLPMELLGSIIDQLVTDIPPNGFTARNIDLMSLLLASRSLHSATLCTLYAQITIPHSRIFRKFLTHITLHQALGTIVRRLDFSHYNPTGAGMSRRERMETMNLIPETLLQCLELTPNLREFLVQEHIDDEVDVNVLRHLLCELPKLKAVDFCACSSTKFKGAWVEILSSSESLPHALSIERLGFHECTILPAEVFGMLLPRVPNLTHLDVAHTRITDEALHSIPITAHLTHLNLSKCTFLTDEGVISFLTNHPAASTLVYLNLSMDAKSHEIFDENSLATLLPALPDSLRSLNLKGSKMLPAHISLLLPLTKHLEELSLGRNLDLVTISQLFQPEEGHEEEWTNPQLRYVDVSDMPLASLDLPYLFSARCPLLKDASLPLEVLEVGIETSKKLEKSHISLKRASWCVREAGRRWWLVRDFGNEIMKAGDVVIERDSGSRGWKWGANYWGMRKIPMARAEVGGMYGHYMFKR